MGEKFKAEHNATIFKSHGAVVKEYVKIPDGILIGFFGFDDLTAGNPQIVGNRHIDI